MNKYIRLIRPNQTGTILIYSTAVFGLCVGSLQVSTIPYHFFWLFAIGAFCMRTAGCVVNDICDRNFDGKVERTKNRPLATGEISVKTASLIALILTIISAFTCFFLPIRSYPFFFLAGLTIFVYPLFKRFTYFPQAVLGLAFAFGFLGSFYSVANQLNYTIIFPFIAIILWTIIYDTIYAMQDVADDIKLGLKSTSIKFGTNYKQILNFLNTFYFIFLLIFWHLNSLKFVVFPIVSYALLTFFIAKSSEGSYAILFKLTPIPCFVLSIGILLNLL